jgi:hypothetical protein
MYEQALHITVLLLVHAPSPLCKSLEHSAALGQSGVTISVCKGQGPS